MHSLRFWPRSSANFWIFESIVPSIRNPMCVFFTLTPFFGDLTTQMRPGSYPPGLGSMVNLFVCFAWQGKIFLVRVAVDTSVTPPVSALPTINRFVHNITPSLLASAQRTHPRKTVNRYPVPIQPRFPRTPACHSHPLCSLLSPPCTRLATHKKR